MIEQRDAFVLTRKRREYSQACKNPKICVDQETYRQLQRVAADTGLPISEIAKEAISFAIDRLQYVDG